MNCAKENARFYNFTEMKRNKKAQEIYEALVEVWGDSAPGASTIRRWMFEFSEGRRDSFEDRPKTGDENTLDTLFKYIRDNT